MEKDGDWVIDCDAGHDFVAAENLNHAARVGRHVVCADRAKECLNFRRSGGKLFMNGAG